MKKEGYYSSGQFAKMAHISVRTVRFYDKEDILKPSLVTEAGARFYTDQDFTRLQQIMLFKYLGFSLDEIRDFLAPEADYQFLANSLELQRKLIQDRISQLDLVEQAIGDTIFQLREKKNVDGQRMLELIHLTGMENSMKAQYQNSSNISARIQLHNLYSVNQKGWFPWVYDQCRMPKNGEVLELGCGNGAFWKQNSPRLPKGLNIYLSDVSEGMIRELSRDKSFGGDFHFQAFDAGQIPYEDESFDLVLANHILFYCQDIEGVVGEIHRVLKKGGLLVCGTYGQNHMREVTELVQEFDERIVLAGENLYERFGKENGGQILSQYFAQVEWRDYEDHLEVTEAEPLVEYVLSCHGNQNQYILDRYMKFKAFVESKVSGTFFISKEAGIFLARKKI
ncbi:MAG: methyltransferase domain-containing protein [Eubacterium sp.]|nr:methyltransferase domain-containing protein [Eubacterium sp.]